MGLGELKSGGEAESGGPPFMRTVDEYDILASEDWQYQLRERGS